jgi:superfamily II helicase
MIRFCWHKWGRWSKVVETYSGDMHQLCVCEKCGAITRRTAVSVAFGGVFSRQQINEVLEEQS